MRNRQATIVPASPVEQLMTKTELAIDTPSGTMSTLLLSPDGAGPFGAVILFVDAGGTRDALTEIGERIAKLGYLVAIPDLFFRSGSPLDILPADRPRDMKAFERVFTDPVLGKLFGAKYYGPALSYDHLEEEVRPLLAALRARPDCNGKIGTTGYCMGGNASLRVATLLGADIAVAASFHGGGLVTDQPDSPHLRVKNIAAKTYVAGASEDRMFPDAAKTVLTQAFADAGIDATIETYPARHGFAVADNSAYDAAAASRHDAALAALFAAHLR